MWIVDGNYVRKNIEKEFTNCSHHRRFSKIPKWELWLDKEYAPGEERFYVAYLLAESRFIDQGMSVDEAIEKASRVERSERAKSAVGRLIQKDRKKAHEKIYKKKLKIYSKGIDVWIVNGELVRGMYYLDFTEGGHGIVYKFIPDNEVWIDDDIGPEERKYVILHEVYERYLMLRGKKYDSAHNSASHLEYKSRRKPEYFEKKFNGILKKTREMEMCYNKNIWSRIKNLRTSMVKRFLSGK